MKIIKSFLLLLSISFVSILFTSCDGDNSVTVPSESKSFISFKASGSIA